MKAVCRTDIGKVRLSNQDASLLLEGEHPVYAVADGMGGHRGGDVASAMAVGGVAEALRGLEPSQERLRGCVEDVNRRIFLRQAQERDLSGMGTTLTILWEGEKSVLLGHVGDSRAYLLRGGTLHRVSTDHSLVGEMVRNGTLTEEAAAGHPYRNVITRAVGTEETVACDIVSMDKQPRDRWLLCSDGLTEYLRDGDIRRILSEMSLEKAADRLMDRALKGGGKDNVTLLVLEVEG